MLAVLAVLRLFNILQIKVNVVKNHKTGLKAKLVKYFDLLT